MEGAHRYFSLSIYHVAGSTLQAFQTSLLILTSHRVSIMPIIMVNTQGAAIRTRVFSPCPCSVCHAGQDSSSTCEELNRARLSPLHTPHCRRQCHRVTPRTSPTNQLLSPPRTLGLDEGSRTGRTHLTEQPGVVLQQAGPVCVRGDPGILKAVLDGRGGANVLVKEFFARLL